MIEKILKKRGHTQPEKGAEKIVVKMEGPEEWLKDPDFRNTVGREFIRDAEWQEREGLKTAIENDAGEEYGSNEEYSRKYLIMVNAKKNVGRTIQSGGDPRSAFGALKRAAEEIELYRIPAHFDYDPHPEGLSHMTGPPVKSWFEKRGLNVDRAWTDFITYLGG